MVSDKVGISSSLFPMGSSHPTPKSPKSRDNKAALTLVFIWGEAGADFRHLGKSLDNFET